MPMFPVAFELPHKTSILISRPFHICQISSLSQIPLHDRSNNKYNISLQYNYEALHYKSFAILPVTRSLLGPKQINNNLILKAPHISSSTHVKGKSLTFLRIRKLS